MTNANIATGRYRLDLAPYWSEVKVDRAGLLATLALCTYALRQHEDGRYLSELEARVGAVDIMLDALNLDYHGEITRDSGNTGSLRVFRFGAYATHYVWVLGSSVEDALEAAAGTLAPGYFHEPDYTEALVEHGHEHTTSLHDLPACEADEIAQSAESDLTYTESGWLRSWEWYVGDASADDLLAWALDLIDRGKASYQGASVWFF